ncbi:hypothetical protein DTO282E5_532 [Paecilomyces variotii]|nr:hypothetical protein DTO282E5_532 [Paecilomyces variotii]
MSQQQPTIVQPVPRRTFELAPSNDSSEPSTPHPEPTNPDLLSTKESRKDGLGSRTGSILNLTSSTLYGIYSPTAFDNPRGDDSTPWGTEVQPSGAEKTQLSPVSEEKPALRRGSSARRSHGFRGTVLPFVQRSVLLFGFGVAYGTLVSHLHENHWITPVKTNIDSSSWEYIGLWGLAGVALGSVLPWLDGLWGDFLGEAAKPAKQPDAESRFSRWSPVVRSIGAFVGIAFATRRLPWQSTAQASLTLALVNPVLWYLVDRSKPGFFLSTAVGIIGMGVILQVSPEVIPMPTNPPARITIPNGSGQIYGLELGLSWDSIAIGTWVASVLFCACVCFGNIGRLLAPSGPAASR